MHFNKKENPTVCTNTLDTTTSKQLSLNGKLRTSPSLHVIYSPTPSIFAVHSIFNVIILFRSNPTTQPELPSFFSCIATAFKRILRPQPRSRACFTVDQSLIALTIRSTMSWWSGTAEQKKFATAKKRHTTEIVVTELVKPMANLATPLGRVTLVTENNDSKKAPIASKQIKKNIKRK